MWQVSGRSEITDFEEVVKLDAGATIEQNNGNAEESENQDLGENSTMNAEEKSTSVNKHSEVQNPDQELQQIYFYEVSCNVSKEAALCCYDGLRGV